MKQRLFLIPALLMLGCSCGSSKKAAPVANADTAKVETGAVEQQDFAAQTFTVTLNANPSTGFRWFWANKADAAADSVECKYIAGESRPMMMGAGGKIEWTFKTKETGADSLVFHYARSFEKGMEPADTYVYHIKK